MRKSYLVAACLVLGAAVTFFSIRTLTKTARREATRPVPLAAVNSFATPADRRISTAQAMIDRAPSNPAGFNLLAAAYMQKARETGDFSLNAKAEAALGRAAQVAPEDQDTVKLRAKLLLTYHRFGEALEAARRAQQRAPRDHDVYGALTDALVEVGDYPGAVEAAQTMVNLRPDTASYSRVSYLRALHGDNAGAIEAMRLAAESASPQDPEGRAWCRVHLGDELMNAGRAADAEREYDYALYIFPDYYAALAAKARARVAAGDTEAAIKFYTRAQERVPLPDTVIALGDLYKSLGRDEEAARQYKLVEFIENAGAGAQTYSLQLALFWADHDENLDKALEIARRERAARADIYTCDTLAWCLFKKGELDGARAAMGEALRLGTRDSRLYYHAGMIYARLGDRRNAAKYLKLALDTNASFNPLQRDAARRALGAINAR